MPIQTGNPTVDTFLKNNPAVDITQVDLNDPEALKKLDLTGIENMIHHLLRYQEALNTFADPEMVNIWVNNRDLYITGIKNMDFYNPWLVGNIVWTGVSDQGKMQAKLDRYSHLLQGYADTGFATFLFNNPELDFKNFDPKDTSAYTWQGVTDRNAVLAQLPELQMLSKNYSDDEIITFFFNNKGLNASQTDFSDHQVLDKFQWQGVDRGKLTARFLEYKQLLATLPNTEIGLLLTNNPFLDLIHIDFSNKATVNRLNMDGLDAGKDQINDFIRYQQLLQLYVDINVVNFLFNNVDLDLLQLDFTDQAALDKLNWVATDRDLALTQIKQYAQLLHTYPFKNMADVFINNPQVNPQDVIYSCNGLGYADPNDVNNPLTKINWTIIDKTTFTDQVKAYFTLSQQFVDANFIRLCALNPDQDVLQLDLTDKKNVKKLQNCDGVDKDKAVAFSKTYFDLLSKYPFKDVVFFFLNNPGLTLQKFLSLKFDGEGYYPSNWDWNSGPFSWLGASPDMIIQRYLPLFRHYPNTDLVELVFNNYSLDWFNTYNQNSIKVFDFSTEKDAPTLNWSDLDIDKLLPQLKDYQAALQSNPDMGLVNFYFNNPGVVIEEINASNKISVDSLNWFGTDQNKVLSLSKTQKKYSCTYIGDLLLNNPRLNIYSFDFSSPENVDQLNWENIDTNAALPEIIRYQKILQTYSDIDFVNFCYDNPEVKLTEYNFSDETALSLLKWKEGSEERTLEIVKKYQEELKLYACRAVADLLVHNPGLDFKNADLHNWETLSAINWGNIDKIAIPQDIRDYQKLLQTYGDIDIVNFCYNNPSLDIQIFDTSDKELIQQLKWEGVDQAKILRSAEKIQWVIKTFAGSNLSSFFLQNPEPDIYSIDVNKGDFYAKNFRDIVAGDAYNNILRYQSFLSVYADLDIVSLHFHNPGFNMGSFNTSYPDILIWNGIADQGKVLDQIKQFQFLLYRYNDLPLFAGNTYSNNFLYSSIVNFYFNNPDLDIRNFDFNDLQKLETFRWEGVQAVLREQVLNRVQTDQYFMKKYADPDILNFFLNNPDIEYNNGLESLDLIFFTVRFKCNNLNAERVVTLFQIYQADLTRYVNKDLCFFGLNNPEQDLKTIDLNDPLLHWEGILNKDSLVSLLQKYKDLLNTSSDIDLITFTINNPGVELKYINFDYVSSFPSDSDSMNWKGVKDRPALLLNLKLAQKLRAWTDIDTFLNENHIADLRKYNFNDLYNLDWDGVTDKDKTIRSLMKYQELLNTYVDNDFAKFIFHYPEILDYVQQKDITYVYTDSNFTKDWLQQNVALLNVCYNYQNIYQLYSDIDIVNFFFNNPVVPSYDESIRDFDFVGKQNELNWCNLDKDKTLEKFLRYQEWLSIFRGTISHAIFFFNNPGIDAKTFNFSDQAALDALSWKGSGGSWILDDIRTYQALLQKYTCSYVADLCFWPYRQEPLDFRQADLGNSSLFDKWSQRYIDKALPEVKRYKEVTQYYENISIVNFFFNNDLFYDPIYANPYWNFAQFDLDLWISFGRVSLKDIPDWPHTHEELLRYRKIVTSYFRGADSGIIVCCFTDFLFNNPQVNIKEYRFDYLQSAYYSSDEAFARAYYGLLDWTWGAAKSREDRYELLNLLIAYQKLYRKYADSNIVTYFFNNYYQTIEQVCAYITDLDSLKNYGMLIGLDPEQVFKSLKAYQALTLKYVDENLLDLFFNNPGLDIVQLYQLDTEALDQLCWMDTDRGAALAQATRYNGLTKKYTDIDLVYLFFNNPGIDDKTMYFLNRDTLQGLNWQGVVNKEQLIHKILSFEQLLNLAPALDIHTLFKDNPGLDLRTTNLHDLTALNKLNWADTDSVTALPHLIRYQYLLNIYADVNIANVFFDNPSLDILHIDFDHDTLDLAHLDDSATTINLLKLYQQMRQVSYNTDVVNFLLNNPGKDLATLGLAVLQDTRYEDIVKKVLAAKLQSPDFTNISAQFAALSPLNKIEQLDALNWEGVNKDQCFSNALQYLFVLNGTAGYQMPEIAGLSDLNFVNFLQSNPYLGITDLEFKDTDDASNTFKAFDKAYALNQLTQWKLYRGTAIGGFMVKNPDIDLSGFNFFDTSAIDQLNWSGEDRPAMLEYLMTYQRLQRISTDITIVNTLFKNGIKSAQHIVNIGETEFVKNCKNWLNDNDSTRAGLVYKSASGIMGEVNHLFATVHGTVASKHFSNIGVNNMSEELTNHFEFLNGYEQLFGSLDYCECDECKSVFGPAAYFVDLMRIVDQGITSVNDKIPAGLKLLERRPDLAQIPLNCENTNQVVSYLQIVNEVLETTIAGQLAGQATPDVYQALATSTYPFNLPYHLPLDQIRVYLSQMGTSLVDVINTLDVPEKNSLGWALEILGASNEFGHLITTPSATDTNGVLSAAYGYKQIGSTELKTLSDPEIFAARMALSKDQLSALFHQNLSVAERNTEDGFMYNFFINKGFSDLRYLDTAIFSSDPDHATEQIINLNNEALDRINRFVRLSKKLAWSYEELDWVITSLKIDDLDEKALISIAKIKSLADKYKIPVITLCACWFDIKTTGTGDLGNAQPLFDKIFNPLSLVNKQRANAYHPVTFAGVEAFINGLYQDELIFWSEGKEIISRMNASNDDLVAIAKNFWGQDLSLLMLGVSSLSVLYRHVFMSKLMGITVNGYLLLLKIAGKQQAMTLSVDDILQIQSLTDWIKASGFSVYELDYILNGEESPYTNSLYDKSKVDSLIPSLQTLMAPLLLNPASFCRTDINSTSSALLFELLLDKKYISKEGVVLRSISDKDAGNDLNTFTSDQISFIQKTLKMDEQKQKVTEAIATFFGVKAPLMTKLLEGAATMERVPNLVTLFINNNGNEVQDFIKRVSRWLLIANKLQLGPEEMDLIFNYSNAFKLEAGAYLDWNKLSLENIRSFWKLKVMIKEFQDTKNDLVNYLKEANSKPGTTALAYDSTVEMNRMKKLFLLSGWNEHQCEYICSTRFSSDKPCSGVEDIYLLKKCFDISKRTRLDVQFLDRLGKLLLDPATSWDTYTNVSVTLLNALKSFSGEDQWPDIDKKTNASIMEHKRSVLSGLAIYLLGQKYTDITTLRELYEFLLIDTEMIGSADISYIKQGLNSVQLYMQRCRLNLEQNVIISNEHIHETWWEWIMNYRVWEANRKVFMYPENYIDPGLRSGKTDLFEQLENYLRQGNIDQQNVEDAYISYVDEFEKLARLKYVDACYATVHGINKDTDTLFMFARTHTEPYEFHYISKDTDEVWSEWQKIGITINSPYITPVYAFNKLFVFWVEVKKHQDTDQSASGSNKKASIWKASVKYSFQNFSGKWMQPQTLVADQVINVQSEKPLYTGFDDYFDENREYFYKVGAIPLSADSIKVDPDNNNEEKILIYYGPLISLDGKSLDDATQLTGDMAAFHNTLKQAIDLSESASADGKSGQVPVNGMIVLDVALNVSSVLDPAETIVFLNNEAGTTSSAFQPYYDLKSKSLFIDSTNNTLCSNYNTGMGFVTPQNGKDKQIPLFQGISGKNCELISVKNNPYMFIYSDQGESFLFDSKDAVSAEKMQDSVKLIRYKKIDEKSFVSYAGEIDDNRSKALYTILTSKYLPGLVDANTGLADTSILEMDAQALKDKIDHCKSSIEKTLLDTINARKHAFFSQWFDKLQTILEQYTDWWDRTERKPYISVYIEDNNDFHIFYRIVDYYEYSTEAKINFEGGLPQVVEFIKSTLKATIQGLINKSFYSESGHNFDAQLDALAKTYQPYDQSKDPEITLLQDFVNNGLAPFYADIPETVLSGFGFRSTGTVFRDPEHPFDFSLTVANIIYNILKDNCIRMGVLYSESSTESITNLTFTVERITTNAMTSLSHKLFSGGIDELLTLQSQQLPLNAKKDFSRFKVTNKINASCLPPGSGDQVSFTGPYGNYYWELFFHGPMLVANMLNSNQQFMDARKWLQYVFNPTVPPPINSRSFITDVIDARLSEDIFKQLQDPALAPMNSEATIADKIISNIIAKNQSIINNDQSVIYSDNEAIRWDGVLMDNDASWQKKFQAQLDKDRTTINDALQKMQVNQNDSIQARLNNQLAYNQAQQNLPQDNSDLAYATNQLAYDQAQQQQQQAQKIQHQAQLDKDSLQISNDGIALSKYRDQLVQQIKVILDNNYLTTPAVRYWQFLPFRNYTVESLSDQIQNSAEQAVYKDNPFDPHAIARLRYGAYEKTIVMQYINNLLDWGDYMFGQYSWESLTTATMLYVYAYDLLGARPQSSGLVKDQSSLTYADINNYYKTGTGIPEFFVQLENSILTRFENRSSADLRNAAGTVTDIMPFNNLESYFCIPENAQFIAYWDRVEDRLYKIRHSLNLQGIAQTLALFEPPIDPMQLVKAVAAGNHVLETLSGTSAEIPHYRFNVMIERAKNFTQSLIQLGGSLLSALEKNDAEMLSILRSTQEMAIQNMSTQVKEQQIEEQQHMLDGLRENLNNAQNRVNHYQNLLNTNINSQESTALKLMSASLPLQEISNGIKLISMAGYATPNIYGLADGGSNYGKLIEIGSQALEATASMLNQYAGIINTNAQYQRRAEEWQLQQDIAQYEINNINAQIEATTTRIAISRQELAIQQKNIDNAAEIDDFLRSKFTNTDLYQWMIGRISTLYYETYKMASDMSLMAQSSYKFELDRDDDFITFDTWNSLRKGLLAGEGLMFSLQQMEKAYLSNNARRFEIEKTISLRQWFPADFLKFKSGGAGEKGNIFFSLSQMMFDFDFPSHYCRKIKSVSISIPAIVGPYQNINAVLTQNSNSLIIQPDKDAANYLIDRSQTPPDTSKLRQNWVPSQQIALSKGIDDTGMFVLDFRDERYLPFEGTGAVSDWILSMPPETNRINFESISDIIVKVHYTALDGGQVFGEEVKKLYKNNDKYSYLQAKMINLKQAFPAAWRQMFVPVSGAKQQISFKVTDDFAIPNLQGVSVKTVLFQLQPVGNSQDPVTTDNVLTLNKDKSLTTNGKPLTTAIDSGNYGEIGVEGVSLNNQWSISFDQAIAETVLEDIVVVIVYEGRPFS